MPRTRSRRNRPHGNRPPRRNPHRLASWRAAWIAGLVGDSAALD